MYLIEYNNKNVATSKLIKKTKSVNQIQVTKETYNNIKVFPCDCLSVEEETIMFDADKLKTINEETELLAKLIPSKETIENAQFDIKVIELLTDLEVL